MTNPINNWMEELEAADIEAGDEITLHMESDTDAFDGDVEAKAANTPGDSLKLQLETETDSVMVIEPDSDSPGGATLIHGAAYRATGHIASGTEVATVHGVSQR